MQTYSQQLNKIYNQAISDLTNILKVHLTIKLFDFNTLNWEDNDEFYDLPQQLLFTDPFFDNYYLHTVLLEDDNNVTIKGYDMEKEEDYDFSVNEIRKDAFLYLVDQIKIVLN